MLIPYTVSRFFTPTSAVYQIYFSAASPQDVVPATEAIKRVLQSRHRAESVYSVQNLTQLLTVAGKIADALTLVLMLVAFVTLAGQRHRHHEHHARDSDIAHPRDRNP